MSTLSQHPAITVDGNLSDWTASERIDTPANDVAGYDLFGTVQNDTYLIAIEGTGGAGPVMGDGTTIWLNTDQNNATGYSPFGSIGADYNITAVNGSFYLYTGAAAQNLVSTTPLTAVLSADGKSLEIAVPRSLLTPTGSTAPTNINIADWVNTRRRLHAGRLHPAGIHHHRPCDTADADRSPQGRDRLFRDLCQPVFQPDRLRRFVHVSAEPGTYGGRGL